MDREAVGKTIYDSNGKRHVTYDKIKPLTGFNDSDIKSKAKQLLNSEKSIMSYLIKSNVNLKVTTADLHKF